MSEEQTEARLKKLEEDIVGLQSQLVIRQAEIAILHDTLHQLLVEFPQISQLEMRQRLERETHMELVRHNVEGRLASLSDKHPAWAHVLRQRLAVLLDHHNL